MNGAMYPGNGTVMDVMSQEGVKVIMTCAPGAETKIAIDSEPVSVEMPVIECTSKDERGLSILQTYLINLVFLFRLANL